MTPNAVAMVSGGLDSTVMSYWLANQGVAFTPLFIDYGQHCARKELRTLRNVIPPDLRDHIEIVDISSVYQGSKSRLIEAPDLWNDIVTSEDFYLPYRNTLLMTVAVAFAQTRGAAVVYSAFIDSNHATEIDCSQAYFGNLEALLHGFGGVKIITPFREMTKIEVARLGVALGAPIDRTFSCQASPEVPCGACPNCVDRLEALDAIRRGR